MTGSDEDQKRELLRRLLRERMAKQGDLQKTLGAPTVGKAGPSPKPAPRDGELELSFGQELVWLLEQIIPEVMFYNVVERFGISGRLDVALLRRSVDQVIERHEISQNRVSRCCRAACATSRAALSLFALVCRFRKYTVKIVKSRRDA